MMTMFMSRTLLMRHPRRAAAAPLLLALLVAPQIATLACTRGSGVPAAQSAATPAAPAAGDGGAVTIDVAQVVQQPLNVQLSLPGELTPYQSVAVHPRVSGFVKTVRVDRGSRVRAGDVMAVLEAPELVAQRAEAQSKLQAAEAQLSVGRAKADADKGTYEKLKAASATPGVVAGNDVAIAGKAAEGSEGLVAAGQQNVEAARQALNAVRDLEGYLRVIAPFDGVVTERNIHPGALVGPAGGAGGSVPMLRVVDQTRLRLVIPVPEAYTSDLKTGAEIPFSVAAWPGQTWTGKVARIAQAVDVTTRTMAIELDVVNKDGRLAPGTFCQVRWPVRRSAPSLFVPSGSVAATTDRTFVIRVRDGKAEWVDVKTGLTSGPLVEVFGNLGAGDQIARRGTDEIRSGAEVRIRPVKAAS
jgi:membrane fusion protein, multidrug efflux system